ncbi:hypothetical protein [Haladaptatus salinisoli]|uniref:hypothetical protein n=1 Tax=Haladaptatus salinisoli TaxID=2884876 RepID=UPI001D0A76D5|nr:hypothetical protein [Haladaptatus salinisoli]
MPVKECSTHSDCLRSHEIEDDKHVGKAYDLGGPEVLTFDEVTGMLYQAEGKPVKILSVPMQLAKVGLYGSIRFHRYPSVSIKPERLKCQIPLRKRYRCLWIGRIGFAIPVGISANEQGTLDMRDGHGSRWAFTK